MINTEVKKDALTRLKKIEGQIRGIMKMVETETYCIDIINQVSAAEKALNGVSGIILKRHVESCVKQAILTGETTSFATEQFPGRLPFLITF